MLFASAAISSRSLNGAAARDRAEDLLLHDLHVAVGVDQHGGSHNETTLVGSSTRGPSAALALEERLAPVLGLISSRKPRAAAAVARRQAVRIASKPSSPACWSPAWPARSGSSAARWRASSSAGRLFLAPEGQLDQQLRPHVADVLDRRVQPVLRGQAPRLGDGVDGALRAEARFDRLGCGEARAQ